MKSQPATPQAKRNKDTTKARAAALETYARRRDEKAAAQLRARGWTVAPPIKTE